VLAGDLLAHAVDAGAPSAARLDVEPVHFEHSRLTCDRRQDRLLRGSEHDRAVVVGGVLDGEHLRLPIADEADSPDATRLEELDDRSARGSAAREGAR